MLDILASYIVDALLAFLILNFAAWVAMKRFPEIFGIKNVRMHIQHWYRYSGKLESHVDEWFDFAPDEWDAYIGEIRRSQFLGGMYEPFVEFRHPALVGRFINFTPEGYRIGADQGAWPPAPDAFNVFFFGGSHTFHAGSDWTAIPSLFQPLLAKALGREVRCYNFGRGAYFSTQEKILFSQLLARGLRPDMAIFFDGMNDFFFHEGRPASSGIFAQALEERARHQRRQLRESIVAGPDWDMLKNFTSSLPLVRAVDGAGRRLAEAGAPAKPDLPVLTREQSLTVIERYVRNRREIELIARDNDISPVFVWQPVPGYGYDLSHHIALDSFDGLGGHARSSAGYPVMAEFVASTLQPDCFLWLADIQRRIHKPLYLDNVHYTVRFNKLIARTLVRMIMRRRLYERPSSTAAETA